MKNKTLISIMLISSLFLTRITVRAGTLKALDEEAFNSLDSTYHFNIKESEFDMNSAIHEICEKDSCSEEQSEQTKQIYLKYVGDLKEKGYDISTLEGQFKGLSINTGYDIHRFTLRSGDITKEIDVTYANSNEYNEEDKKAVDEAIKNLPEFDVSRFTNNYEESDNYQILYLIDPRLPIDIDSEIVKDSFDFNTLVKDKNITIKATKIGKGAEGLEYAEENYISSAGVGFYIAFYRKDVLYAMKSVWFVYAYGTTLDNGLQIGIDKLTDRDISYSEVYTKVLKDAKQKYGAENIIGFYELEPLGATYKGMEIPFDIDLKYNGRNVEILHKKKDGTFEIFIRTVENGKVTVKVDELSPFMIILTDKKADNKNITATPNTTQTSSAPIQSAEPLENPKTLDNILFYVSMGIVSLVGCSVAVKYLSKKVKAN